MSNQLKELKSKFKKFLAANKNKKFVICTHIKGDIDAISSAYGTASAFPNSIVAVPDELNESAKRLVEKLQIKYSVLTELDKSKFDGLIVVDTSAYTLIKPAKDWNIVCIIDHHLANGRDMSAPVEIFDEKSPSCAEIVTNILPKIKDEKITFALACAIIADTARFKNGRKETFETLAKLMEISKANYAELLSYAEPELPTDSKVAVMKAFQRLRYHVVANKYVIATSEVGSNESDAASHLSNIVDAAFVASYKEKENELRISARGSKSISVPLNEVMKAVSESMGGKGGGHAKAAGCSIPSREADVALDKCIQEFIGRIRP